MMAVVAIIAVIAIIALYFLVFANPGVVGTWEYSESQTVMGQTHDITMTLEFEKDGTGSMEMESMGQTMTEDFEWEIDGDELVIENEDGTTTRSEFEIKDRGNTLVFEMPDEAAEYMGDEIEFERVD